MKTTYDVATDLLQRWKDISVAHADLPFTHYEGPEVDQNIQRLCDGEVVQVVAVVGGVVVEGYVDTFRVRWLFDCYGRQA